MSTSHIPTSLDRRDSSLPESHLIFSIVSLLFCLPVGIFAILASVKVRVAIGMNNISVARDASARAAKLSLLGVMLGSNVYMLITVLVMCILFQAT
ncbi:synapse differentiation-inducing gene protein 1-like [Haliotis cracherodii]|uniref:synapse differentiation-inducing gene protein 1-like n=1 Tax=Haliotis cracherodii TaxID=6455 RepID=UPI0039ECD2BA